MAGRLVPMSTSAELSAPSGGVRPPDAEPELAALAGFVAARAPVLAITGAGCSTESGIPDYRAADGSWKRSPPLLFQDFLRSPAVRRRYWARSLAGWPRVREAGPNPAHAALARLEQAGLVHWVVTQNVDGLHQRAGSRRVIDLHGRLDGVVCIDCSARFSRQDFQQELLQHNPGRAPENAPTAPDGDVDLDESFEGFHVPDCRSCGGILKPDVVLHGESVPRPRVDACFARLSEAGGLLAVGTSLMVWSSYRFARGAAERGLPIAAVNIGRTRADELIALKLERPCGEALPRVLSGLGLVMP
jgi:NAD-dependent SIR2 family protein deacetylase